MPGHRRTATRVKDGRVQKKNNWVADRGDLDAWTQADIKIERRDPGQAFRHLLTVADLRVFLELLPVWDELTVGLDGIVLDHGGQDCMGWHRQGIVAICAWERDLWWPDATPRFVEEHRDIFELLDVRARKNGGSYEVRWTEDQARAFQLLNVLPHELGHHHDRMTTRSTVRAARGEPYAETYARREPGGV